MFSFSLSPDAQVGRVMQLARHWETMSMLYMPNDFRGQMLAECARDLMQRLYPCSACGTFGRKGELPCTACDGRGWATPEENKGAKQR